MVARATGKTCLLGTPKASNLFRGTLRDEADDSGYDFANARRRSNSSTKDLGDFKTKFEMRDSDPVFEEELHGPTDEDVEQASMASMEKEESTDSSTLGGSVDDEEAANKKM